MLAAMNKLAAALFLIASACGGKSAPAPAAATEPATPAEPTATGSDNGSAAMPTPTAPEQTTKCATDGGHCMNMAATMACKRFEQTAEWGCGTNEGCCLPN